MSTSGSAAVIAGGGFSKMPPEGQSTITIRDESYEIAEQDARSEHRSVANYIQHLIAQEREWKIKITKLREELRSGP